MPAVDALNDLVFALAGSAWVYPVVFALVVIDGFFPPLPSETVVVALGALAVSAGAPHPVWLIAVTTAGAVLGDSTAYLIGRRIGPARFGWQRRPGVAGERAGARAALLARPASLLLTARYIPVGRVAVNMTAGATGFPARRFVPLAVLLGVFIDAVLVRALRARARRQAAGALAPTTGAALLHREIGEVEAG
jgi:membrane-associated protein